MASIASPGFALAPLPPLRDVDVAGCRVSYYDAGAGPPLVLVHGIGGDADQWCFGLAPLAARYRVIALDLPGFGRSGKPAIDYRIAGYVATLDAFLAPLVDGPVHLLGHSLGGWVAASFALAHPDRVQRLVLNDAVGIDDGSVELPCDLNVTTRERLRGAFEAMFFDPSKVDDGLVDLAWRLHVERNDGPTIRSLLQTLAAPDEKLDARLSALQAPTLLLWGEDDRLAPMAMARAFAGRIAACTVEVIPRCGHLPCIEAPQSFYEAVLRFLADE